jgi:ParB/RepB/Spo0J family partition protein
MKRDIREIDIALIDLDTSQPRQEIEEDKLLDLAADIKETGLLVPILLTPYYKKGETLVIGAAASKSKELRWFVLDGYRRVLACKEKLGWKMIDAEIRIELTALDVFETQFRANAKRVQVTVKEMAKAITRYGEEWKNQKKKGDIVERLSKLTGYSTTYFKMAENIVKEPNKKIKELVDKNEVGAYYSTEKLAATKDENIRNGLDDAVIEYQKNNPNKKTGALTPRVMKPVFKKILKNIKNPEDRRKVSKAKTLEYLNRSLEKEDESSQFEKYLYDTEEFYEAVLKWNLKGLTQNQVDKITSSLMKTVNYLREKKRGLSKLSGAHTKSKNL